MGTPLSILDLAPVRPGETPRDSFAASVQLAQRAEESGFRRVWYAEHHNMPSIASSATSVLIAHVAAHTERIRLGAGGVMLPNHSPLVIAEQFGTLEMLHPGRIDLGLGRAPGSDLKTARALRRGLSAERFPDDVVELQAYLSGSSVVPGVSANPGSGTNVPLYILGSSLFGARLAAHLGLPYAFASHFAPGSLRDAVEVYRREFSPSAQLEAPYVIAGLNVTVSETSSDAKSQFLSVRRSRVRARVVQGQPISDDQADQLLASPVGRQVDEMLTYAAVGTPAEVVRYVEAFATHAEADELIVALQSPSTQDRIRSLELLAEASPNS
jgi:luciferase family oxidoreductase group 1